jgi:hypothetical protein
MMNVISEIETNLIQWEIGVVDPFGKRDAVIAIIAGKSFQWERFQPLNLQF